MTMKILDTDNWTRQTLFQRAKKCSDGLAQSPAKEKKHSDSLRTEWTERLQRTNCPFLSPLKRSAKKTCMFTLARPNHTKWFQQEWKLCLAFFEIGKGRLRREVCVTYRRRGATQNIPTPPSGAAPSQSSRSRRNALFPPHRLWLYALETGTRQCVCRRPMENQ